MQIKIIFTFIMFMSLLLSSSLEISAATSEVNVSNENIKKIEEFIEKQMEKGDIPGLSVTIVNEDKTVYKSGFGYADIDNGKEVTSDTLFELGSTSKAFTALGVLTLVDNGTVDINAPITDYIPWLSMTYKGEKATVTVRDILYHTSGVPFNTISEIPISNGEKAIEATVRTLVGVELDSTPGEKFQYATINYDILGLLIEKTTGIKYEEFIKRNILEPMGLNNTYMYDNEFEKDRMAQGYKQLFTEPRLYNAPSYEGNKPAGYIITNSNDMEKWLKIQLGVLKESKFNNNLIEKSHIANRRVEQLQDGSSYASGWFVYQKGGGEISHGGNNPNYSSFILFRPEEKIGIAVLSNINSAYVENIGNEINKILLDEGNVSNIKDLNMITDYIAVAIICVSIIIIATSLGFIIKVLKELKAKRRYVDKKGKRGILKILASLIIMMILSYCIYLIPYIFYDGVDWKFTFIWLPSSIKWALYLGYACLWLVYAYSLLISFVKKKDDKSLLMLSLVSIASGLGNALIILTINLAINSDEKTKINLIVYFVLGIIIYVYGQKIVRAKVISITNEIVYFKRMQIVKKLLSTPYEHFENIEKGTIESTLNNDTETISNATNIIVGGITSAITLICCFAYLSFINFYVLLLSLGIILFIASIYYLAGRYANRIGEESRDLENIFFKYIFSLVSGFKELTLSRKKKQEFQNDLEESSDRYKDTKKKSALAFANMFVMGELLFTLAIGCIALVFPVVLNNLETANITSYVFILLYMIGPIHAILDTIPNIIEIKISLNRITTLIDKLTSKVNSVTSQQVQHYAEVQLQLKDVAYEYNQGEETKFKVGPINYQFNSGEIIFITGGNGSGKSTFAKLITGLYTPTSGNLILNGNTVSPNILNEYYSAIFNDFFLFEKLYGIDYTDKENEIKNYLKILQLDKKVEIINGKFSTTKLSTGQKKRLALLVSYLDDRPIYVFDEWTADQDPEFRLFFYSNLLPDLQKKGKCIIAVTHDDRYFSYADKVIKMDMGKMISLDNQSMVLN
ncbi:cyclic peptide transporter [Gracilibacillus orientalis]|uniref:Cyclic peptide transporter n=1 Tax=Gracilibacillus orientalis TaxID=334253 RepID=A0A1I4H5E7_9BACI|nr:cyclic peptide export ABC transporter [Gracilibacillus orientalis]SFL37508.1 cyclic peptide transporter [Gracilibacillus orientalis]